MATPIDRAARRRAARGRSEVEAGHAVECQVNMCGGKATEKVGIFPRPGMLIVTLLCETHALSLNTMDDPPPGLAEGLHVVRHRR